MTSKRGQEITSKGSNGEDLIGEGRFVHPIIRSIWCQLFVCLVWIRENSREFKRNWHCIVVFAICWVDLGGKGVCWDGLKSELSLIIYRKDVMLWHLLIDLWRLETTNCMFVQICFTLWTCRRWITTFNITIWIIWEIKHISVKKRFIPIQKPLHQKQQPIMSVCLGVAECC